jgi:hypothetical protein
MLIIIDIIINPELAKQKTRSDATQKRKFLTNLLKDFARFSRFPRFLRPFRYRLARS